MAIPADVPRRKPALVVPVLTVFVLFSFVAIVVMLLRINSSNDQFRAEVEKELMIDDMGAAIQKESQIIGSWMAASMHSEDAEVDTTRHETTLETLLAQPRQRFDIAANALQQLLQTNEQTALNLTITSYNRLVDSAAELDRHRAVHGPVMASYHTSTQPLEAELYSAIEGLHIESAERVDAAIANVSAAEAAIGVVLPIVAIVALGSVLAVSRLNASRRNERNLEDLVSAKDEIIASVSHELRTPLTGVVGLAVELEAWVNTQGDVEADELISLVVDEAQQAACLVEDLLVAARFEIGTVEIRNETTDLRALVEKVLGESVLRRSSALQSIDLGSGCVTAYADPNRVRQILRNLLSNAVRYGGEKVTVTLHRTVTMARIQVIDNGAGVPVEQRERIFDAYVRSAAASQHPDSVGLGLSVARRLARQMNGELTYRYEGNSSVFELTLPAGSSEASTPQNIGPMARSGMPTI